MNIPSINLYSQNVQNRTTFSGKNINVKELQKYVYQNYSNVKIAQIFDMSTKQVSDKLRQANIKSAFQINKEKKAKVITSLYKQGLSCAEISKKTGQQKRTVEKFLNRNNLPTETDLRYYADIEDTKLREIANKLKLSKEFLDKNLK